MADTKEWVLSVEPVAVDWGVWHWAGSLTFCPVRIFNTLRWSPSGYWLYGGSIGVFILVISLSFVNFLLNVLLFVGRIVLEPGDAQMLFQMTLVMLASGDFGLFLLHVILVIGVKHGERVLRHFLGEAGVTGDGLFHFQHSHVWVHFSSAWWTDEPVDDEDCHHLVGYAIIGRVVVVHHSTAVDGWVDNCMEPLFADGTTVAMLGQKCFDGSHTDEGVNDFHIKMSSQWVSYEPKYKAPMGLNVGLQIRLWCEEQADELTQVGVQAIGSLDYRVRCCWSRSPHQVEAEIFVVIPFSIRGNAVGQKERIGQVAAVADWFLHVDAVKINGLIGVRDIVMDQSVGLVARMHAGVPIR